MANLRGRSRWAVLAGLALLASACGNDGGAAEDGGDAADGRLSVYAAYATEIEEPWDGVIHEALQAQADAGEIDYDFTDAIGYSGDMERVLREVAEGAAPDIIFGDAFGNEEAVRRVAAD